MKLFGKIAQAQKILATQNIDGWLLYDFRRSNDIACKFLDIPPHALMTRRFFYWIPKKGSPQKIIHRIEPHVLSHLPGTERLFAGWEELNSQLKQVIKGCSSVAMEYSPHNELPYVSKVDAGTVEMISSLGVRVVSSSDLLASPLNPTQIAQHLEAAVFLDKTAEKTWQWITKKMSAKTPLTEWDVQVFITQEFTNHGYITEEGALCAVNANSANPHYQASQTKSSSIEMGDLILIDLSCRKNLPDSIYADITRMAVASSSPTPKQQAIFDIVRKAQRAATDLVRQRIEAQQPIFGYEVDDAARQVIRQAGYHPFFTHRTGHNLHTEVHGPGTHMDNFETHDTRPLLHNTCFTIEPGIYLPNEFGIRLEYDILIHPNSIQITGGSQNSFTTLFP